VLGAVALAVVVRRVGVQVQVLEVEVADLRQAGAGVAVEPDQRLVAQ
jgi:hypothetical protein